MSTGTNKGPRPRQALRLAMADPRAKMELARVLNTISDGLRVVSGWTDDLHIVATITDTVCMVEMRLRD